MSVSRCLVLLGALTLLLGCSVADDWGDDHVVLDQLQLLEDNDLWVELFSFDTQPAGCNLATCQGVVRGKSYAVIGDVDDARAAALNELMQTWEPRGTADPFEAETSDFQLRDDVEIATTTGTAFLTVRFTESFDLIRDEPVPHAIVFTLTSDIDPNYFEDMVLTRDNFSSPGGIALIAAGLTVVTASVMVLSRRKTPIRS